MKQADGDDGGKEVMARVVKISEIHPHPDPLTDQIGFVRLDDGRQVVVRLDTYMPGALAVYFVLGAVLPDHPQFRFIWEGLPRPLLSCGVCKAPVPLIYRRVGVRNMRGLESQGLLQPVIDFMTLHDRPLGSVLVREGMDVTDLLGVV